MNRLKEVKIHCDDKSVRLLRTKANRYWSEFFVLKKDKKNQLWNSGFIKVSSELLNSEDFNIDFVLEMGLDRIPK